MKNKIKYIVKWVFIPIICIYLFIVIGFFLYLISLGYPLGFSLYSVDTILVTGPVKRIIYSVSSDKQMIAHFLKNREVFEKITNIVGEHCIESSNLELNILIKNIGAEKVESAAPIGGKWLPSPYSKKSLTASVTYPKLNCQFRAVGFFMEKYPYDDFWKGIIYLPEPPLIINGILQYPGEPSFLKNLPAVDPAGQVLPSLDYVVGFFRVKQSCRFREIETQWFLFVCPESRAYYYIY